jgi:hypothetical protein
LYRSTGGDRRNLRAVAGLGRLDLIEELVATDGALSAGWAEHFGREETRDPL